MSKSERGTDMSEDKVAYAGQAPAATDGYVARILLAELADEWCDCDAAKDHKLTGADPFMHSETCLYRIHLYAVSAYSGITTQEFVRIAKG